jgi:hypothetical protein
MPDENAQVSDALAGAEAAAEVADKPTEGSQKGSTEAQAPETPAVQEHRDWRAEIEQLPESDLYAHPRLRSIIARKAKSEADKAAWAERQRVSQEIAAQQERQRRLNMDPEELGKQEQQRMQQEEAWNQQVAPAIERARQDAAREAWNQGYIEAYKEVSKSLESLPHWKAMDQQSREAFVMRHPDFTQFVSGVLSHNVSKETEKELNRKLKDLQHRQETEEKIVAKIAEPSPVVTEGSPDGWDYNTIANLYAASDPRVTTSVFEAAYKRQFNRR